MRQAIEALLEARDHSRNQADEIEDAISILKVATTRSNTDAVMREAEAATATGRPSMTDPLGQPVTLHLSGEKGRVIGFATYLRSPPQFYVEYLTGDGRQAEGWFSVEQLLAA